MIYEMCFAAPQSLDEPLSALLSGAGSMGVVVEDTGRKAVFSASELFERCQYKGYFEATINRRAVEVAVRSLLMHHKSPGDCEVHWVCLEDQDWQERWKRHFKPMMLGKRLLVLPSWLPLPEGAEGRVIIRMDPEMAFGSGTHETTRGCLEALEDLSDQAPLGDLLDMGTGSGILIIGGLLLGAKSGLAVDSDPIAVETCARNCRANLGEKTGWETRVRVQQAEQLPAGPFDTVVANILAPVLTEFLTQGAVRFRHCVAHGGHLVLSGMLHEQAQKVEQCALQHGFVVVTRRDLGEWSMRVLRRED